MTSSMGFEEGVILNKGGGGESKASSAKGSTFSKAVRRKSTKYIHSTARFEITLVSHLIFRNSSLSGENANCEDRYGLTLVGEAPGKCPRVTNKYF